MAPESVANAAVIGASGYTGGELLRLLASHPRLHIKSVTSEKFAGRPVAEAFPHLASVVPLSFEALSAEEIAQHVDVVFLALPHTKSFQPVYTCLSAGNKVVDLSADFRLREPASYQTWYQTSHPYPTLLSEAVYGLPELRRAQIESARLVAAPGCYPTAAILQLAPLVERALARPGSIIIDAKSGISGAGRAPALPYHFPEANESLEAYSIGCHRHTPEIEQELAALARKSPVTSGPTKSRDANVVPVSFTPHLVPMNRGILSTAYARLTEPMDVRELRSLYRDYYKDERFVRVHEGETAANPRHVRGSNYCDLAVFADNRNGLVITTAALDNLVKGAAGQAIQAMNLMLGYPEHLGLVTPGVYP